MFTVSNNKHSLTMRKISTGIACVIKGQKGKIVLQGFITSQAESTRLEPMFKHYLGATKIAEINKAIEDLLK
jgi:hypothetical protein